MNARDERGSFTLELLVLLPLLMVIVFVILEFGRVYWQWVVVTNAAREGARFAVTQAFDPSADAAIMQRIVDTAQGLEQSNPLQKVACSNNQPPAGSASCIGITRVTCPNPNYPVCGGTGESILVVLVRYRISAFTPITGSIPWVGNVNFPAVIQITGLSTMRVS